MKANISVKTVHYSHTFEARLDTQQTLRCSGIPSQPVLTALATTGLKDAKSDAGMEVAPAEQLKLCLSDVSVCLSENKDTISFVLPKFRITKPKRFGLQEEGATKKVNILFGSLSVCWSTDAQLGIEFRPNPHLLTALSTTLLDVQRYSQQDRYLSLCSIVTTIMFSLAHEYPESPPISVASIAVAIVLASLSFFPQLVGASDEAK